MVRNVKNITFNMTEKIGTLEQARLSSESFKLNYLHLLCPQDRFILVPYQHLLTLDTLGVPARVYLRQGVCGGYHHSPRV